MPSREAGCLAGFAAFAAEPVERHRAGAGEDTRDPSGEGRCSLGREVPSVEFSQGDRPRRVVVAGLPAGSVSKDLARTMYVDESPAYERPIRMAQPAAREAGAGRPTKRDRREMEE